MLKKTIEFTDFNGVKRSEDLYFHVSKTTILTASDDAYNEILSIGTELQEKGRALQDIDPNNVGLTIDQTDPFNKNNILLINSVRTVAKLLDRLVDLSYGKRSEDGLRFVKNEQVLNDFKNSALYDAFVEQLIGDQDELVEFINNLLAQR